MLQKSFKREDNLIKGGTIKTKLLNNLDLYCGDCEEYKSWNDIEVNLIRNKKGYKCHKSIVRWEGRGCPKNSPYYMYKIEEDTIFYANLLDTDDVKYITDELMDKIIDFIDKNIKKGEKVLVYCAQGKSRAPSICLLYLLKYNYISKDNYIKEFKKLYPEYEPLKGFVDYIEKFCQTIK